MLAFDVVREAGVLVPPEPERHRADYNLSGVWSEYGTIKTVKAKLWPWPSVKVIQPV